MKVKELMKALEKCNPESVVVFDLCEVEPKRLREIDEAGEGLVEFFECEELLSPANTVVLGDW